MHNSHTESPHLKSLRDENPSSLSSPELNTSKKRRRAKKNKGQGAPIPQDPLPSTNPIDKGSEQNEQLRLCPNPNPPTLEKEQAAEPNGVITQLPVSDSTLPTRKKKRRKKKKVVLASHDVELPNSLQVESEVKALLPQVCHKHELANSVVQEKGNFVQVKETTLEQPQYKQEHESVNKVVEHSKENRVGKNEGVAEAEHPELVPLEQPKESNKAEHPQVLPKTESPFPLHTEHVIVTPKRRKGKNKSSALNQEVAEPDKHKGELPVKHNPVSKDNVKKPANKLLKGNGATWHGRCFPFQKPGHRSNHCPGSNSEEICFFCGKFGHSLANCSVSEAGGQFAWCLFCYSNGHFTNKCPKNGHGIDPKVVVADASVNKTVEAQGEPNDVTVVTNNEQ